MTPVGPGRSRKFTACLICGTVRKRNREGRWTWETEWAMRIPAFGREERFTICPRCRGEKTLQQIMDRIMERTVNIEVTL
jgi:hypothetical protein